MPPERDAAPAEPGPYAWYMLAVLVLVYVANYVDRQLLTILAPELKRDLGISDAEFGFLYGTAFGVFYALFGIPLGRLADRWSRTRLLALGLTVWSLTTALSGLSRSFAPIHLGCSTCRATCGNTARMRLSSTSTSRLLRGRR